MTWSEYDSAACSIARTVHVLGDRWTVLVIRDLFNGVRRFDALHQHLGIARDILTKRLQLLVDEGIVDRRAIKVDGERARHEYVLTAAGRELRTVLVAIMDWGDRHRSGEDGPPVALRHGECGGAVHTHLLCDCGAEVDATTRTELVPLAGSRHRVTM